MEKKNMVLLTVIAVATLLVAVVGATFAYFSTTSSNEFNGAGTQGNTSVGSGNVTGDKIVIAESDTDAGSFTATDVYPGHKEIAGIHVNAKSSASVSSKIKITYDVTVTNMGEVDYNETQFYYIGKVNNPETIVRTSADVVMDYVANNLQFRTQSNQDAWDWSTITEQEIQNNNYVNTEVQGVLKDYNTIITTEALNEKLIPLTESTKDSAETQDEVQLILTQLITSQNEDDDLTYDNIGEIVKISNDVGRRMAYSVQGNQNPKDAPTEPDSSMAERVVILPPFGEVRIYYIVGVLVAAILIVGIVLIKKKVLKK